MSAIDEELEEAHRRAPVESSAISARYGRTPERKRRIRWTYIGAAAVAAAVLTAWAAWSGLAQVSGTVDAVDGGATILSDRSVSISYQVSMPPGDTASCALQVQNAAHAIVGWRIVKIPASTRSTTAHTHVVLSSERGVTGLIYSCWLT
ncbi:MAG: hypothetical protein JWM49_1353 [Microbacteriaceae bacterium]|jgi:hypothetical protein|nr:hypothetical protein [Microbacteriaceae bacterium]